MADGTLEAPSARLEPPATFAAGEVAFGPLIAGGPAVATIEHILASLAAQVIAAQAQAVASPARPTSSLAGPLYVLGALAALFFGYYIWFTGGLAPTPALVPAVAPTPSALPPASVAAATAPEPAPMTSPVVILADPDRELSAAEVVRLEALIARARELAAGEKRHVEFRLILGQRDYRRLHLEYARVKPAAPSTRDPTAYVLDSAGFLVQDRCGVFPGDAEALVKLAEGVR